MVYYALTSLLFGPFFFVILLPLFFRYRTLRYAFDDEGVSMRWGVLFRKEIHLTYARIQDIHLVSNVVERWLGLGRVQVQTASGSSKAEMTIEGLREFEAVRDFLYVRMRGMGEPKRVAAAPAAGLDAAGGEELTAVLREVAEELRGVRRALAERAGPPAEEG